MVTILITTNLAQLTLKFVCKEAPIEINKFHSQSKKKTKQAKRGWKWGKDRHKSQGERYNIKFNPQKYDVMSCTTKTN